LKKILLVCCGEKVSVGLHPVKRSLLKAGNRVIIIPATPERLKTREKFARVSWERARSKDNRAVSEYLPVTISWGEGLMKAHTFDQDS